MPLKEPTGAGDHRKKITIPVFHPKKGRKPRKTKSTKKGRHTHKAKKAKTLKARKPPTFHEAAGAGTLAGATADPSSTLPFAGSAGGSAGGASPRPLLELSGLDTVSAEGLGGALLDLVGEGKLTVSHALAAWTHEQDRLANRAWRRPGGLQRMGGL